MRYTHGDMTLRLAALITLAAAVFFLQRAADPIFEQNDKVRQWPAVEVTVTVRFVRDVPARRRRWRRQRRCGQRVSEIPAASLQVEQRHEVDGQVFRTLRPNPRAEDSGGSGLGVARAGRRRYVRRGHYDPQRPGQVFFPTAFGFRDYLPIFIWAPLLRHRHSPACSCAGRAARRRRPSTGRSKGWHRLRPKYSMALPRRGAWSVAILCNLPARRWPPTTTSPASPARARPVSNVLVCLATAAGRGHDRPGGLLLVDVAARRRADGQRRRGPRPPRRAAGREGRSAAPPRPRPRARHGRIDSASVTRWRTPASAPAGASARCTPSGSTATSATAGRPAGNRVTFEQRFRIPPDAEPSSLSHAGLPGPWIDWYVEVDVHLDGDGPDYHGRFPITVERV